MIRRAIVTGASSGVGRRTARLLADAGVEVVLAARRLNALDGLAQEIGYAGGTAHVRACDVTDEGQCRDLVAFAQSFGEAYPILINNAGNAIWGSFHQAEMSEIESQIGTNLMGPIYLSHAFVPWALAAGGGQVVNVASVTASEVFPGTVGYSVSKAGLVMLGKVLAAEYRKQGLRVTNLLPGAIDTPIWDDKSFVPPRGEMIPLVALAETIRDLVLMPADRNVDEIRLMPPKGVL